MLGSSTEDSLQEYLTESTMCTFLSLALQLTGANNSGQGELCCITMHYILYTILNSSQRHPILYHFILHTPHTAHSIPHHTPHPHYTLKTGGEQSTISLSVSQAAQGTSRQIVALLFDGLVAQKNAARREALKNNSTSSTTPGPNTDADADISDLNTDKDKGMDKPPHFHSSALFLLADLAVFIQTENAAGDWMRTTKVPQIFALELLIELLEEWPDLFRTVNDFNEGARCVLDAS